MNIVFMGTPEFSVPTLERLFNSNHTVIAVVTQPDRPKGRGIKLQPSPIKTLALSKGVTVFQPEKANHDEEFLNRLKGLRPDIVIVAAYGQILSQEVLDIPKHGCVNLHASLLPKYRGAAPINWAVINGDKTSGVTVMKMDKGMDTGDMLLKRTTQIMPSDNSVILHDKLSRIGAEAVCTAIEKIENGTIAPEPQNNSEATYAPRLKKSDGLINWNMDAGKLVNLIRGSVPWPCAYTYFKEKMIKIWDAEYIEKGSDKYPGEIDIVDTDNLDVAADNGAIRIKEIQMQSRRRMRAKEFIQGNIVKSGDIFMQERR